MSTFRNIWFQIAQTSGAKVYQMAIAIVTLSITARYLGPEGRGILAAARSWAATFATIAYLSIPQVIMFIASGKKRETWLPQVFGTVLGITAVLTLCGWGAAAWGYYCTDGALFSNLSAMVMLLAFMVLPCAIWLENGNNMLMAIDSLRVLNIAIVVGTTINLFLVFLLVAVAEWGVYGALYAGIGAQYTIMAITLIYLGRKAWPFRFDRGTAGTLVSGGLKLHLNAIGTLLVTHVNVLIVNHFRATEETGYFQLCAQLLATIQILPTAVGMVVYTIVSKKGPDKAWPEHKRLLGQSLLLVSVIAVILFFAAPLVIHLLAGAEFMPAVPLFRILLLTVIGMTLSIVMSSQWIARGFFLRVAFISLGVGILSAALSCILVPRYGMYGAAWASVFTYGISVIINGGMAIWVQRSWKRSLQHAT